MADKIRVNTEILEKWSGELSKAADALSDVNADLGRVNTSEEAGGEVDVTIDTFFKTITGKPTTGTVRSCLAMLRLQIGMLGIGINGTARDLIYAANRFGEAEGFVGKLVEGAMTDPAELAAAEAAAQQAMIDWARQTTLDNWQKIMAEDEARWPDLIDVGWLNKAASVGFIYTVANGTANEHLVPGTVAANVVDNLVEQYSENSSSTVEKIKTAMKAIEKLCGENKALADTLINILDVGMELALNAGDNEAAWDVYLKKLDILDDKGLGKLFEGLGIAADSAKNVKTVVEAVISATQLANMDPATVANLQKGLAQNGDPVSQKASDILDMSGDVGACVVYAFQRAGLDLGIEAGKSALEGAISSTSVGLAVKTGVGAGTMASDMIFNTGDTAAAANYTISVNDMRVKSMEACNRAIEAYRANPTDANYEAAQQAYETYNALSAEMTRAYQETVTSNADSPAGKVFYDKTDFDYLNQTREGFESRVHRNNGSGSQNGGGRR